MQTTLHRWSTPIKRMLPSYVWQPIRSIATCVVTPIRFSMITGHARSSFLRRAVDKHGKPIPWYTYPAIDFLGQRDFHDKTILEFGSGQSTLWWSSRAQFVLSVEEDPCWFAKMRGQVPGNVELHCIPADMGLIESFFRSRQEKFDVIIIDGSARAALVGLSFELLAPNGAIILDNSDGYGFYEEIRDRPCRKIDFVGFAPGVVLRHCTSIAYLSDCFLLFPDVPVGAIT
jgi:hypothetical protein